MKTIALLAAFVVSVALIALPARSEAPVEPMPTYMVTVGSASGALSGLEDADVRTVRRVVAEDIRQSSARTAFDDVRACLDAAFPGKVEHEDASPPQYTYVWCPDVGAWKIVCDSKSRSTVRLRTDVVVDTSVTLTLSER